MPEPLTSTQLENALKMAAKVVETFGDDWQLRYDPDGDEVSCRTDDEGPIEGSFVEVFSTSQWPSDSDHSPAAEFLRASIVMVPRLIGEVERLNAIVQRAHDRAGELDDLENAFKARGRVLDAVRAANAADEIRDLFPAPDRKEVPGG